MAKPLVILHLSDAHFGNPKRKPEGGQVLTPLIEDLKRVRDEQDLKPNLVLFSGDLAYGTTGSRTIATQYPLVVTWLNQLYSALDITPESTPLLTVPGNHDVNKVEIGPDKTAWLNTVDPNALYQSMETNDTVWKGFLRREKEWRKFATTQFQNPNLAFDRKLNSSTLILEHSSEMVGVAGLNSSWGSFVAGEEERGHLWIGKYQLDQVIATLERCTFKIAVSHHPTAWLNSKEATEIQERIESKFQVHLHGHEHSQWFSDAQNHLRVAAGPCYSGAVKENAYSWLVVDFDNQTARLFLRRYEPKGEGGWIPFVIPGKTDIQGMAEIRGLFAARSKSHVTGKNMASEMPNKNPSAAEVRPRPSFAALNSFNDYIQVLQDRFGFRWEPSGVSGVANELTIYWPVRLRRPTPIHAVQCFAASGLQRLGARVVLCLDDLGSPEVASTDVFLSRVKLWFTKTLGQFQKIQSSPFSAIITSDQPGTIWQRVEAWLGTTPYKLKDVLRVCKLSERVSALEELYERRPRRLLTPPLVWSCLDHYADLDPEQGFITLGGHDEHPLWRAWRELTPIPKTHVGHLYAPELMELSSNDSARTLHMAATALNLAWDSRDDVENAFEHDLNSGGDFLSRGRLLEWCFTGCVMLPAFLTDGETEPVDAGLNLNDLQSLKNLPSTEICSKASAWVAQWLL